MLPESMIFNFGRCHPFTGSLFVGANFSIRLIQDGDGTVSKEESGNLSEWNIEFLGGGFKDFLFSTLPGQMIQFD